MKIVIMSVGKAHEQFLRDSIDEFTGRIGHYMPVEWKIVDGDEKVLKIIDDPKSNGDYIIALDEKGKILTSVGLADRMQKCLNESTKRLIFLIGGAYGLTDEMRQKASVVVSLSGMTFPHQLVRLIIAEQIYRACTILKGEKYHH